MSKIVIFPGLGLEFELNPIAFSVFGWDVHWYGVIIACGFLLAVAYCYWRAPRFGVDQEKLIDMLFFAVPLCIIGARAYYVIFNPAVCFNADGSFSLYNTIAIWDGGLAIYGAIIMAILTVAVYCKVRRQNFWDYTDIGCFGVLIGQLVGRWGNFVNVEAFGGVTDLPWRMCSPSIADYLLQHGLVDEAAYQQVLDGTLGVHPTFFYESMWNLLGFILLFFFLLCVGSLRGGVIRSLARPFIPCGHFPVLPLWSRSGAFRRPDRCIGGRSGWAGGPEANRHHHDGHQRRGQPQDLR